MFYSLPSPGASFSAILLHTSKMDVASKSLTSIAHFTQSSVVRCQAGSHSLDFTESARADGTSGHSLKEGNNAFALPFV